MPLPPRLSRVVLLFFVKSSEKTSSCLLAYYYQCYSESEIIESYFISYHKESERELIYRRLLFGFYEHNQSFNRQRNEP
ncbi:hypothetical protein AVEN_6282-1 [Araneus ventricosus]|uniref:Uncharacterized protein n=1 Tax=Araneus ventricosus TaxID=182803 RepID=A0A4Y2N509_ARAVE|nr:hypothetical protein AVEN_6282-1 [Araneus ventricosus]